MKTRSEYDKEYYLINREKKKEREKKRYLDNKEKILTSRKEYYLDNRDTLIENSKDYYNNNKEKVLTYKKEYRKLNISKIKKYRLSHKVYLNKYYSDRYRNDNLYRLGCSVRSLIRISFDRTGYCKKTKTENILGCTIEEFKLYLESKFEPWMNWNNYGNWNGEPNELNVAWDIDHIIPVSTAKNEEDIIKLNHYSNLCPLCSYTNRHIKRNKITC